MACKNDPYAVVLRALRRGLGDGKGRDGKDATGEWLAARWLPYLEKRAKKASPCTLCAEIAAILGDGTPPAWFRREAMTEEEREVLEKALSEQREARKKESRGAEALEEQAGNTHILVEELHSKAFARQESIKKRTQRELRQDIANMTQEEVLTFWSECQEEFSAAPQEKPPEEPSRMKRAVQNFPPLKALKQQWNDEDRGVPEPLQNFPSLKALQQQWDTEDERIIQVLEPRQQKQRPAPAPKFASSDEKLPETAMPDGVPQDLPTLANKEPATWPEFQKANKGKFTRKEMAETWQTVKKRKLA